MKKRFWVLGMSVVMLALTALAQEKGPAGDRKSPPPRMRGPERMEGRGRPDASRPQAWMELMELVQAARAETEDVPRAAILEQLRAKIGDMEDQRIQRRKERLAMMEQIDQDQTPERQEWITQEKSRLADEEANRSETIERRLDELLSGNVPAMGERPPRGKRDPRGDRPEGEDFHGRGRHGDFPPPPPPMNEEGEPFPE